MQVTGSEPGAHPLERIAAILAAILCLALFVVLWASLRSHQAVWPLPGLYFLEMAILAGLGAYVFLPGRGPLTAMSWGAAGALTAFSILGAWTVGGLYLPAALMLAIVSLTSDLRNKQPLHLHLGVFLLAGLAQAYLILALAGILSQAFDSQSVPALTATDAATQAPSMTRPSPSSTPALAGGLLPTLEAGSIRSALVSGLSMQRLHGVGSPGMRQVTGWSYGYRGNGCPGFRWLDSDHLLLYPSAGQVRVGEAGRVEDLSPQPAVVDLESGQVWLPQTTETTGPIKCDSVYWSLALGLLVQPDGDHVLTSTADGKQVDTYPGRLLSVSPAGERIMVGDHTLIDLASGRSMDFAWQIDEQSASFSPIFWSPDEKRAYRCCFFYGDTGSGQGYAVEMDGLKGTGQKPGPGTVHSLGEWVRGGEYFLIEWSVVDDGYPDYFPLFDPVAKKYYELSHAAGIPEDWTCVDTSVSPDSMHVWVSCWEGSYLVDLRAFHSIAYPGQVPVEVAWSSGGSFAWLELTDETQLILSVSDGSLVPMPSLPSRDLQVWWHPVDDTLTYLGDNGRTLELLNAANMSLRSLDLPSAFVQAVWSPAGDRLALLAEDGSAWQIGYPALENPERLSPPMPGLRDLAWSPDAAHLAFISGPNLYIIESHK